MKRKIFELKILRHVFIQSGLALFGTEFTAVLSKFHIAWIENENSKLQPAESTQAGQNSASY